MHRIVNIFLFLVLSIASIPTATGQCSHARKSMSQLSSTSPEFSDLEYKYDVNYYYIDLLADDNSTYIEGFTQISLTTIEELDTLVFELSKDLSIDSILFADGDSSTYIHTENLIQIALNKVYASGDTIDVTIFYNGTSLSGGFFAGLTSKTDYIYEQDITYTLSEPFQASKWFPVKQDLQDKADSVRVHISVEEGLMAGSNGILENITDLGNGMNRYEWFSNYPIAYYLISFTVSDYIDYSFYVDIEGAENPLLVQNFIYDNPTILDDHKENIDKTESLLQLYSDLFGIYPFIDEKYGHCMAPIGGGMEHQTMTTLQNFNFELVAHELAHQWFGDYVTCSSWQDIWVNEGFASYGEYLALEFLKGEAEAIEWMDEAHNLAFNAKTGSIYLNEEEAKDPSRIFSYYLSYKKGASIINMLRYEINNDEKFFNILKTFISRHKNSLASANDFLEVVNEISIEDYSWFFDQWYYGEGYPIFQVSYKTLGDSLFIESNQEGVDNPSAFFKTHFDIKINFENGQDTILRLFQEKTSETFSIPINSKLVSLQLDPYSRLLMNSTIFEALIDNNELLISPNPFTNYIELFFSNVNSEKIVYVNDTKGSVVYKETLSPSNSHTINLDSLHSGTYILTLRDGNQKLSKKIIKL